MATCQSQMSVASTFSVAQPQVHQLGGLLVNHRSHGNHRTSHTTTLTPTHQQHEMANNSSGAGLNDSLMQLLPNQSPMQTPRSSIPFPQSSLHALNHAQENHKEEDSQNPNLSNTSNQNALKYEHQWFRKKRGIQKNKPRLSGFAHLAAQQEFSPEHSPTSSFQTYENMKPSEHRNPHNNNSNSASLNNCNDSVPSEENGNYNYNNSNSNTTPKNDKNKSSSVRGQMNKANVLLLNTRKERAHSSFLGEDNFAQISECEENDENCDSIHCANPPSPQCVLTSLLNQQIVQNNALFDIPNAVN
jgi:hypothetical protein